MTAQWHGHACARTKKTCLPRKRFPRAQALQPAVNCNLIIKEISHENPASQRSPRQCLLVGHCIFDKITGLIETASTKYCSSVREKAEIGGAELNNWVCDNKSPHLWGWIPIIISAFKPHFRIFYFIYVPARSWPINNNGPREVPLVSNIDTANGLRVSWQPNSGSCAISS
jgi:hypothetical protein